MASLTLLFFLPAFCSVFSAYLSSALSTRPRQFLYSLTNESNTQTEGTPTPGTQSRILCRDHGRVLLTALFPMTCSAHLYIAPRITLPVMKVPTMTWALIHRSSMKKKVVHRLAYRPIWWSIFSAEIPSA